ncbi:MULTISPECIES: sensor domain-containing diguanylate cyclase [unclassified Agarivorans]|uniref:sensor domain-containing diguanylate cyclase n=1 Tax=unclassified Agarivorans TaxID=2636026 RepID=UPI0026E1EE2E|nr:MULTISPECIES: diguanylate cyclase [unclassified Agarivorans]MDO6686084.1 diguanylate cyclase [Agarivorans sp. 3_MG-2023]MDO6713778.1 diguanylate cyclase [Agarivorans sp. 2_MG-2023]
MTINSLRSLSQQVLTVFVLLFCGLVATKTYAESLTALHVNGLEDGSRLGQHFHVWHDESGSADLADAIAAFRLHKFSPLKSKGSTGLQAGAFWSVFYLHNDSDKPITLNLEYVDHQLIYLSAYQRNTSAPSFLEIADLALSNPFSERLVSHQRFVVPVELGAGETYQFYFRFGSDEKGFVFPDLRLWQPDKMHYVQSIELGSIAFLVGGLALMAIISLVTGVATNDKTYYAYFVYAGTKLATWPTILGFSHMFFVREDFHWSYMSLTGAMSIMTGVIFARIFLQTKVNTPRLDYVLKFMILNAGLLALAALTRETVFSVVLITIALLLYPVLAIASLIRWYQGSKESAVYTLGWTVLIIGLFSQALRDLGLVEHTFVTYYWPVVASYSEMMVIMVAMGIHLFRLRRLKEQAELRYRSQLERAKQELEILVSERTHALEVAKSEAEKEARTDPLTGINNRRSFMAKSEAMFDSCRNRSHPMSMLMFDIDHFKKINDNHGHAVGDQALKLFATTIESEIRDGDVLGRLGGEEFGLALYSDKDTAIHTAERLRSAVERIYLNTGVVQVRFTTSIGVALMEAEESIEQLMSHADQALYKAKESGRNKAVVSAA